MKVSDKNKVGIVYSPGFGAGWSTWGKPEMALDQELARAIEDKKKDDEILRIIKKNWPDEYCGGVKNLTVEWVDELTQFRIEGYDGSESILFNSDDVWNIALKK